MFNNNLKNIINKSIETFQTFSYEIKNSNNGDIHNFIAINTKSGKQYAIYCVIDESIAKSLIMLAEKKIPNKSRLVVICGTSSERQEYSKYNVIPISAMVQFKQDMEQSISGISDIFDDFIEDPQKEEIQPEVKKIF